MNYDPSEYYREGGFADPDLYPIDEDEGPVEVPDVVALPAGAPDVLPF